MARDTSENSRAALVKLFSCAAVDREHQVRHGAAQTIGICADLGFLLRSNANPDACCLDPSGLGKGEPRTGGFSRLCVTHRGPSRSLSLRHVNAPVDDSIAIGLLAARCLFRVAREIRWLSVAAESSLNPRKNRPEHLRHGDDGRSTLHGAKIGARQGVGYVRSVLMGLGSPTGLRGGHLGSERTTDEPVDAPHEQHVAPVQGQPPVGR